MRMSNHPRRGVAAVEFAVIAPLLFLLILGIAEFGRMMMVQQILTNGAREGARKAVLPSASPADGASAVASYLANAGIQGSTCQATQNGEAVTVTVQVPYVRVTWLPSGALQWLKDTTLTARVVMRKEATN